jgi:hypothetical protein
MNVQRNPAPLRQFDKFVVWGFRRRRHSHRFIHQHFYSTLKKLGVPVAWVEDAPENNAIITKSDLVIAANIAGDHLDPTRGAHYVLHNFDDEFLNAIPFERRIVLQVYTKGVASRPGLQKWGNSIFFDPASRTLYQPWGTDLLPEEFRSPLPGSVRSRRFSFFVGSIWNNEQNQGNLTEISVLTQALKQLGKRFVHVRHIPNSWNTGLVRRSCLAPAIGGGWQVENHYLPCRMFKNISYGHLGISNISGFDSILGDTAIAADGIPEMIDAALSMSDKDFTQRIADQQLIIREHCYDKNLMRIAEAMTV